MIWIVWSNENGYGCCKSWDGAWKAITALRRNGYEVCEIDMTDFNQFHTLNLKALERVAILKALDLKRWSQKKASVLLGITPRSLNYKISNHGIINERVPNDGRSTWTKHSIKREKR